MIIDYDILGDESMISLSQQVREHIKDGWQPFGNLVVCLSPGENGLQEEWFYQPMVRYA